MTTTMTPKEAVALLRRHGTVAARDGRYRVNLLHGGGATEWMTEAELIALAERYVGGEGGDDVLSPALQDCARRYVAAQERSGHALLEACAALCEARSLAQHGEWGIFLTTTRTSEGTAKRLLDIYAASEADPAFRDAVRRNWIGATVAAGLAQPSFPVEARQQLLDAPEPPTTADVHAVKQAAKSATVADLGGTTRRAGPESGTVVVETRGPNGSRIYGYGPTEEAANGYIERHLAAPTAMQLTAAQERAARLGLRLEMRESGAFVLQHLDNNAPAGGAVDWRGLCDLLDRKELAAKPNIPEPDAAPADAAPASLASPLIVGQRAEVHRPDPREPPAAEKAPCFLDTELDRRLRRLGGRYLGSDRVPQGVTHTIDWPSEDNGEIVQLRRDAAQIAAMVAEREADPALAARVVLSVVRRERAAMSPHTLVPLAEYDRLIDHLAAVLDTLPAAVETKEAAT